MDPLVTVIVRTFNRPKILRRAVQSVLNQTFDNFELIIVDDASGNETAQVIEDLAREDHRIYHLPRAHNSRTLTTREEPMNDGLRAARGDFVAHLDDDNTWRPDFLRVLVGELETDTKLALAYSDMCNHLAADSLQETLVRESRVFSFVGETAYVIPHFSSFHPLAFSDDRLSYNDYIDTNEMVLRIDALKAIGGQWLPHPRASEINEVQGNGFEYRNHADLYVVERIASAFSLESLKYVPRVLADYVEPTHPNYLNATFDFSVSAKSQGIPEF